MLPISPKPIAAHDQPAASLRRLAPTIDDDANYQSFDHR